ncbi:MAG: UDP-N-acetylglucosamine--N-acetylmuramyl-(pentapeptide) pyrophosphoryl-undecaprenol N-acetylglucosamine transferase [Gaiellales bacterium]
MPALAVADELSARGAHVEFAGADRIEASMVPEAGYPLHRFEVRGFERRFSLGLLRSMLLAGRAPLSCRRILAQVRPDVVFGAGGYVSGPMLLAARTRRLPAALLEVDAHMGLANRLAAPLVQRVFLAYPIEGRDPPRYRVTGRPVPAGEPTPHGLPLPAGRPVVVVFGGSLGARSLNEAAVAAWADEDPGFTVVHVTGERDIDRYRDRASERYLVLPWTPHLRALLDDATLVVARAGGSVFEIAAAGRPSVLVPSPNVTGDHQTPNARHFERGGAAVVIPDAELDGRLLRARVAELVGDPDRLRAMREAAAALARPDAAAVIVDDLLELAR